MSREVKKIFIVGRPRCGKTRLISDILDKYRSMGLSICFYNKKSEEYKQDCLEVNLEGYTILDNFKYKHECKDLVILESEQVFNDLDIKGFTNEAVYEYYSASKLFIVTCLSTTKLDRKELIDAEKIFNIVIDFNIMNYEEAKAIIERMF